MEDSQCNKCGRVVGSGFDWNYCPRCRGKLESKA